MIPKDDIELRSEEVRDILTRPPHALVRWGISVFFGVLALLFIGGCFFSYPDAVTAEVTVTTEHPPVWIVAKGSGKIRELHYTDRDSVHPGNIIAVLENPAYTKDVLLLKQLLQSFSQNDSCIQSIAFPERPALGSIQSNYASFLKSLTSYKNFLTLNLYAQQITATEKELNEYQRYISHLENQIELDALQNKLSETAHHREQTLFEKGLISESAFEEAEQSLLAKKQNTEQLLISLSSARIQEAQLQQTIIETKMERNREENSLRTDLKSAFDNLRTSIGEWELNYLFVSPASGILSYNNIWQANQNVNSGDRVFSIVAKDAGCIIGKIKLPADGAGKVRTGQQVNISLTGYPNLEFGFLTGTTQSISLLSDEEQQYTVTVNLPQDLCTSYGKQIPFTGEMTGTAEILTDKRSLTERLLEPLRYVWEKYRK